jgi:hypothetical protein
MDEQSLIYCDGTNNAVFGALPYRPTPETVARIAEFLALCNSLDGTSPADVEETHRQIGALAYALQRELDPGRVALIHEQIADLQRRAEAMLAAISKAAPDYRRVNQLGLHLAMELPAGLWRAVRHGGHAANVTEVWAAVDAVREAVGAEGHIMGEEAFWAAPGIGKAQPPQGQPSR